ncbi:MAG: phosphonate transport system substrate-binding protein [Alphaproteobacteria bacterium]|jgi:phosphonate transport system substrate-binding protein
MATLIDAGLKPVRLDSLTQPVPAGHVGYVFAQSEANITAWTVRGLVDAGAYADSDWRHKGHTPKRDRKQLRIFYSTPPLMRSTLLVRKGLPAPVRAALLDVLGKFGTRPEHEEIGRRYYKISRFGRLESATSKELKDARKIYRTINPLLD